MICCLVTFAMAQNKIIEKVHTKADEMPYFPGCEAKKKSKNDLKKCSDREMLKFIYGNLSYPQAARKKGVEGRAIIQFTIMATGEIGPLEDILILRDPGAGTGEVARDIVVKMKNDGIIWNPAILDGKAVNFKYVLPVQFRLEK